MASVGITAIETISSTPIRRRGTVSWRRIEPYIAIMVIPSAERARDCAGRTGQLSWQDESYDHWVR